MPNVVHIRSTEAISLPALARVAAQGQHRRQERLERAELGAGARARGHVAWPYQRPPKRSSAR